MIFINFKNGEFTSIDTDKRFTRIAFNAVVEPLSKRLGSDWLSAAQAELDGMGNLDLSELSRDDFTIVCRALEKSAKTNQEMSVLFDEIAPLLRADSRFQAA